MYFTYCIYCTLKTKSSSSSNDPVHASVFRTQRGQCAQKINRAWNEFHCLKVALPPYSMSCTCAVHSLAEINNVPKMSQKYFSFTLWWSSFYRLPSLSRFPISTTLVNDSRKWYSKNNAIGHQFLMPLRCETRSPVAGVVPADCVWENPLLNELHICDNKGLHFVFLTWLFYFIMSLLHTCQSGKSAAVNCVHNKNYCCSPSTAHYILGLPLSGLFKPFGAYLGCYWLVAPNMYLLQVVRLIL